jgi:hypothetical protein
MPILDTLMGPTMRQRMAMAASMSGEAVAAATTVMGTSTTAAGTMGTDTGTAGTAGDMEGGTVVAMAEAMGVKQCLGWR